MGEPVMPGLLRLRDTALPALIHDSTLLKNKGDGRQNKLEERDRA